jgi:hypothetical protein
MSEKRTSKHEIITTHDEIVRFISDVSIQYSSLLASRGPISPEVALDWLAPDTLATLVKKRNEYIGRYRTGMISDYASRQGSGYVAPEIADPVRYEVEREGYKLTTLSVLLDYGVLDASALKSSVQEVEGVLPGQSFFEAVDVIENYAHQA